MTTNEEEDFDFSFFEKTYDFNYCNNWDFETNNIFLKYYFSLYPNRNNLTFFDIGCNGGSFVKSAKLLCENPIIHCFEPHPKLSELVSQHYPDIKMNQLCVSNQNGTCDIFIPLQSVLISSMIDRPIFDILRTKPGADGTIQKVKKYNVQSKTIDTYCKENNIEKIDYLKIDVEGAEMMVLEGAKEMLKTNKIIAGQFEIGSTLDDAGIKKEDIFSYLQNYGYEFNTSLSNDDVFFNIKKN
jgi:FkbM family methyltransferase